MDDISSIDRTAPPAPRRLAAALLTAALVVGAAACSGSDDGASGDPMPTTELIDLTSEEPVELAELADGRPTVVNLWASWCAPCRKEMPAFDEVATALGDEVAIVGITDEDDLDAARDAAAAADVAYPLLVDTDQQLLTGLGVSGLPGTVFLDEDGNVVGKHLGAMDQAELTAEIEDRYGITS